MSKTQTQQNGWQTYSLAEVIDLIGGGTPKTTVAEYWNGDIPWLSVADFNTDRKFVFDSEKKITEKGLQNSSTKILNKGDIIISARGTVGVIATIGRSMAFNQSCYGLRAKEDLTINGYVYYLLKNAVANFLQRSHGGVFDTITQNTFKEIDIDLPPLPEQKAIAEVLSSLDDKIDLLHRQNKTLEGMAQVLFRKWFVEEAKEDWEEKPLGEITEVLSGFAFKSSDFVDDGQYRLVTIKNVQDGYIDLTRLSTLASLPQRIPEYCQLKIGDILLSLTGNVGRCCLVTDKNLLLNQRVAKLKPKNLRDRPFVYFYLRQQSTRNKLEHMARGTAQLNLSPVETGKMKIKTPPEKIFLEFANVANDYLDKILHNYSQIRTLENLRDTLLPKLMSGAVRVKF
jgi:type I restriction enzyme, S subunit